MITEKLRRRLRKVNMAQVLKRAVDQNKTELVAAQRAQLNQGLDADGEKIGPPYKPSYKAIKRRLGLPVNKVTLKLTGELHSNFKVTTVADGFMMSTTRKSDGFDVAEHLKGKYSQYDIYGVNKKKVIEIIKDDARREFRESMQTG